MKLLLSLLSAGIAVCCLGFFCEGGLTRQDFLLALPEDNRYGTNDTSQTRALIGSKESQEKKPPEDTKTKVKDGNGGILNDFVDYNQDFEDEEEEEKDRDLGDAFDLSNIDPLMRVRQRKGEILVPCFGMWWPVGNTGGGPPPTYDYYEEGDDYYGDYKKKRRRARKRQKKTARKKRKKA